MASDDLTPSQLSSIEEIERWKQRALELEQHLAQAREKNEWLKGLLETAQQAVNAQAEGNAQARALLERIVELSGIRVDEDQQQITVTLGSDAVPIDMRVLQTKTVQLWRDVNAFLAQHKE